MDPENFLLSLLIVLVAAPIAAEASERLKQPAVLGEIIAGILIGPSVLGIVHGTELLLAIGELGAILLLFEVGMHMDLPQLRRVGGDSLRVAGIGIVIPMVSALFTLRLLDVPPAVALFMAGAVTATSVGITARVFGDLRALASPEARTVLGAAVADDVGGLLILTVVVAVSSGAAVSAGSLASIVAGALFFVLLAVAASAWAAPGLFRRISSSARTDGTLMALALAFAVGLAIAASAMHLAPIIGAFIAGLALSRTGAREELQRRLVPLAHFFVPIFFLLIGIETDLAVFGRSDVAGLALLLTVVAIAGKLASGLGVRKGNAGRLLVGVGMVPRGEVGLIFAGIGLSAGIVDSRYYGVLVAVVLATTLLSPPWVRRLAQRARRRAVALSTAVTEPPEGWLKTTSQTVELNAEPPDLLVGRIGFEAAVSCASRQPGPWLLQWLSSAQDHHIDWDDDLRRRFFALLRQGNARSWRFLQATGLLHVCLPLLEAATAHRKRDPFNLEPGGDLHWYLLEEVRVLAGQAEAPGQGQRKEWAALWDRLPNQDLLLLAALCADAFEASTAPADGRRLAGSIGLDAESTLLVEFLVGGRVLPAAAAGRLDALGEEYVLELASHLGSRDRADAVFLLAAASGGMMAWEEERLRDLFELVQTALEHAEGAHPDAAGDPVEVRRRQIQSVLRHFPQEDLENHLRSAPRRYLLAHSPEMVARHLKMTSTQLGRFEVRLEAEPSPPQGKWTVHVVASDRKGLLAEIAGAFAHAGVSVEEAFISTWRDGKAIDVFKVSAPVDPDWAAVGSEITGRLSGSGMDGELSPGPVEGTVSVDNLASPWHTIVEIRALDREGLLHRVASALAGANLQIHMAVVHTEADVAVDIFYLTGRNGGKLNELEEHNLRRALSGASPRRLWRRHSAKQRV